MSFEARLKYIEKYQKEKGKKVYVFTIDHDGQFESEEQLEKELQHPKYENATIIINNLKAMRDHLEGR